MAETGRGRFLRLVKGQSENPVQPDPLASVARAACEGAPAAVRTFLVTVGPHLLRVVRRVLGAGHPDVDDVVQESAFAVMDALPRHRGESTVLHFACRIAVLVAMNVRRREAAQKRAAVRDDGLDVELVASDGAQVDAEVATRAITHVLRELLDSLPIEQAEALALHCVLGYTIPEIAATSGAPQETVRSRLRLAKQALRERVGDPRLGELVGRSSSSLRQDSLDDLVALSRRGGLSDAEQRHLREALSSSPETMLLYEAGRAFDLEAPVLAGDDERLERVVRAVEKGRRGARGARRASRVALAVAAGILLAVAAVGAIGLSGWLSASTRPAVGRDEPTPSRVAREASKAGSVRAELPKPAVAAGAVPGNLAGRPEQRLSQGEASVALPSVARASSAPGRFGASTLRHEDRALEESPAPTATDEVAKDTAPSTAHFDAAPARSAVGAAPRTAGELFAAANTARMRGDVRAAVALYEELESEFPKSNEAATAHLSLGVLCLQQNQPARALQAFRLARGAGGTPPPEALWGEAQALRQLGRANEERGILSELLARYPEGTAYSAAARKRLADLR